jgi:DNA-binding CsgD family transcriptional regulator
MAETVPQHGSDLSAILDCLSRLLDTAGDSDETGAAAGPAISGRNATIRTAFELSQRARPLVDALRMQLAQASENALLLAAFKAVSRSRGVGIAVIDAEGTLLWVCPRIWGWLAHYFPDEWGGERSLPSPLAEWVSDQLAIVAGGVGPQSVAPFTRICERTRLAVRFILIRELPNRFVLHFKEYPGVLSMDSLSGLGLSRREMEILTLVARGETNTEIGRSLKLSPRTVQTHLAHIYHKVGVDSRTAAAVWAFQMAWKDESGNPLSVIPPGADVSALLEDGALA